MQNIVNRTRCGITYRDRPMWRHC